MKKVALSLIALAVIGVGAFADAPKWDPKVSTDFKGEATVTLGYDLDNGVSAFKNGTSVSLIVDLVSGGDRVNASDKDVWGEIKIKTDGDPYRIKADGVATDGKATFEPGFKLQVDYAKIHFGKEAYLTITSKDTKLGYANSPDLAFLGHWFSHNALSDTPAVAAVAAVPASATIYVATGTEVADANVTYTTLADAPQTLPLVAGTKYIKTVAAKAAVAAVAAVTKGTKTPTRYGADNGAVFSAADSYGAAAAGGLELGYAMDKVASVKLIVGTVDAWSTDLVNKNAKTQIAYKVVAALAAVENLTLEGGYAAQTLADSETSMGGKVAYTLKLDGDKLYVKPVLGVTMVGQSKAANADKKAYNIASASVLLGTGPKAAQFDNFGLKLDSDYGAYPGVSVGVIYNDKSVVNKVGTDPKASLALNVSANSGALVADTTLVAAYDVADLNAKDVYSLITLGASTKVKAGDIGFTPTVLVASESGKAGFTTVENNAAKATDSALFLKFKSDITGLAPFVTLSVAYDSNDLLNGYQGTAANDGKLTNDKFGKIELTTKISF